MGVARLISHVFNPAGLALMVFFVWGTFYPGDSGQLLIGLFFYVVLPGIVLFYLLYSGRIDALYPQQRQQRDGLLLAGVTSYGLGYISFLLIDAHPLVCATGLSFCTATLLVWLINRSWKISIHCVGVGGAVSLLCIEGGMAFWPSLLLVPLVSWARFSVLAHTRLQIVAGLVLGCVVSILAYALHVA